MELLSKLVKFSALSGKDHDVATIEKIMPHVVNHSFDYSFNRNTHRLVMEKEGGRKFS